jgi:hypothetical protein
MSRDKALEEKMSGFPYNRIWLQFDPVGPRFEYVAADELEALRAKFDFAADELRGIIEELNEKLESADDELRFRQDRIEELESYRRTPNQLAQAILREEDAHLETARELDDLVESQLKEIQRLNDRIEELDGKLTMQNKALFDESCEWFKDKHIITTDQIDAAWEEANKTTGTQYENVTLLRFLKKHFGIKRCENCDGDGAIEQEVIIGEHYVTHEMALDAGMPEAEGSHYGYEYGSEKGV